MNHYDLLERMIGGDLSPHLSLDENVSPIFYYISVHGGFQDDENTYYKVDKDFLFEYPPDILDVDFNQPRKILKTNSGEIWVRPSKKAYYYYEMIDAEKTKIIRFYNLIYKESKTSSETAFQVQREIHIISILAKKLYGYKHEQVGAGNNFASKNSNHYIIYLLQETLIDLILEINNIFEGLIPLKKKDSKRLRNEYFGSTPFELKNLVSDESTIYLLHRNTLKRIFEKFNPEIFNCNNLNDFCEIFAINDIAPYNFEIKHKTRFYYLLDQMWEKKDDINSKISLVYPTKASYITPFLNRYGGDFKTFGNRTVLSSPRPKDKVFRSEVEAIFK